MLAHRCVCIFSGGRTPLHCAASSNNIEAVQLLIEHGAGVLAFTWDAERETPLDKCCPGNPGYEECYQIIAGTDCSQKNALDMSTGAKHGILSCVGLFSLCAIVCRPALMFILLVVFVIFRSCENIGCGKQWPSVCRRKL